MKKLRKLLPGFMMLAMVISLLPMLAPITAYGDDTITGTSGNLTIHKYEYNGNSGVAGTGTTNDENSNGLYNGVDTNGSENTRIPIASNDEQKADPENYAIPLAGVTFRITLVDTLDDYYKNDNTALKAVTYYTGGTYNDNYYKNEDAKVDDVTKLSEGKWMVLGPTGTNGTTTISGLPLGIYLVQEIEAPNQITGYTPDFLVSIPMTTVDGDNWLYDVHVYPKNKSTYASVTLKKYGKIGNDTATILVGATFKLQLQGANNAWTTVTQNNKGETLGESGLLTTDSSTGQITVSDLAPGSYRFVEITTPNGYIMDGNTTHAFTITDEGTVKVGDSIITSPIEVTNYRPDMDKQIKKDTNTYQEAADYSVGDDVPYIITIDVPSNIINLKKFVLTDEPTGLDINKDTVTVKMGTSTITNTQDKNIYTVEKDNNKLTITFNPANMSDYAGQTITIEYTAELLATAVTTTTGNPNTATLEYSNQILPMVDADGGDGNPNTPTTATDPTTSKIKDDAVVYTFKLKVNKTGEDSAKLNGVIFDVYSYSGTGTPTEADLKGDSGKFIKQITTAGEGYAEVSGLANGTYYLVETKTNAGYNLLKAPEPVTINVNYNTTWDATNTYEGTTSTYTKHSASSKAETFNNAVDASRNGYFETTIINRKGFTLPTTGGVGTYIFIFVGVSMMAAAVILFFVTKKKDVKKSI